MRSRSPSTPSPITRRSEKSAWTLPAATKDWREIEFLASLKSRFALSDNQMDVAMQTAAQFPAVELGGDAPP